MKTLQIKIEVETKIKKGQVELDKKYEKYWQEQGERQRYKDSLKKIGFEKSVQRQRERDRLKQEEIFMDKMSE